MSFILNFNIMKMTNEKNLQKIMIVDDDKNIYEMYELKFQKE
jgi:hypothetical protein